MKTNKITLITTILFILIGNGLTAQQYFTNVHSHYSSSITHGVKIKTTLPYSSASAVPTVKIEGNDYGKYSKMLLNLTITWYAHNDGILYYPVATSNGSSIPDIYIADENGFVIIYLDEQIGNQRFNISLASPMAPLSSEKLTNWTVVDEPLPANAIKVPYSNNFGGKVGINTEDPKSELDVNGTITSQGLNIESGDLNVKGNSAINNNLLVKGDINLAASRMLYSYSGSFNYQDKTMTHYGLKWENDDNDPSGYWFWLSSYSGVKFFTGGQSRMLISKAGRVGINTETPISELDVNGTITAKQLNLEGKLTTSELNITSSLKTGDLYIMDSQLTNKVGYGKKLYLGESWDNSDDIWISRYNKADNETDLRIHIGDDSSGEDNFVIGNHFGGQGEFRELFIVSNNGNVGIGQSNPQSKLEVNGIIRAHGVKMTLEEWSDFVFDKNYKLPALSEIEAHIKENKHLPGIPSEKEVMNEGIDLGQMQAKLLQKIEELTLYAIEQEKKSKEQEKRLQEQELLIKQLQNAMLNKNDQL